MSNNKAFKVKNGLDLGEYSKAIADTAVDVFVYDTSKDSDGGAWRKRTQHTSWYNETLNTATRGSRKEFPAVAVIVAESNQVTIYDGDDPDLPMWMVFNPVGSGRPLLSYGSGLPTSLNAVNGVICFGLGAGSVNDGQAGIVVINFVSEFVSKTNTAASNAGTHYGPIVDRNLGKNSDSVFPYGTGIVNNTVNDVAVTVLPNAPIDAATGLPVPTIAVATDGGVSVIKDDGAVVDITGTLGGSETKDDWVYFDKDGSLFMDDRGASSGLGGHYFVGFTEIPSADTTVSNADIKIGSDASSLNLNNLYLKGLLKNAVDGAVGSADAINAGLNFLDVNKTSVANSMIAYTTSDYATGWMNGDIKLATLSDTDDTDVTGSELVTNGTFDTDTSGWTEQSGGGASLAVVSGELQITGGTLSYPRARQEFTTVVGQKYVVSATARQGTTSNNVYIYNADLGSSNITYYSSTTNTVLSFTFTASSTTSYVELTIDGISNGTTAFFDNVSVRLAEEDRSVNGNGLQVFGTVTKNPVATGADLVGYSGFSGSNYLRRPANTDLPDGATDDFCMMGWVNLPTTNDFGDLISFGDITTTYANRSIVTLTTGLLAFATQGDNTTGSITTSSIEGAGWSFITAVGINGTVSLYINGIFQGSDSGLSMVSPSESTVTVGVDTTNVRTQANYSLALWRISATAPSPEQIAKIYEDEKFLFQDDAQATLYGSSDAVTALAYDDSTNLLHVGTSAGRSVFQGLRRVDNTTTAVSAAISASNNLVGEQ